MSLRQIVSKSGDQNIVGVNANGQVTLSPRAIFDATPSGNDRPYRILVTNARQTPPTTGNSEPVSLRDIGILYTEDNSVTSLVGIRGCVLSYNEARINKASVASRNSSRNYNIQYAVTTITVGIPVERYRDIRQHLKEACNVTLTESIENESGGYIWIDSSIIGVQKDNFIDPGSVDYFQQHGTQIFTAKTNEDGSIGRESIGPFYQFLQWKRQSIVGTFFGNLRIKRSSYTKPDGKVSKGNRLGFTIHHLQVTGVSDAHAPDQQSKASEAIVDPLSLPTEEMSSLLEEWLADPADDNDGEEGDEAEIQVVHPHRTPDLHLRRELPNLMKAEGREELVTDISTGDGELIVAVTARAIHILGINEEIE